MPPIYQPTTTSGSYALIEAKEIEKDDSIHVVETAQFDYAAIKRLLSQNKKVIILFFVFLFFLTYALGLGLGFYYGLANKSRYVFKNGAVASSTPECSKLGRNILRSGGSAVDAAIAALLCEGVYRPESAGVGGSAIFTIYDAKNKSVVVIDGREMAPQAAHEAHFVNPSLNGTGGLFVGVPGTLRAMEEAHRQFGRLPWRNLFTDLIGLAREGVPIPPSVIEELHLRTLLHEQILWDDYLSELFFRDKSQLELKSHDDVIVMTQLSRFLDRISIEGANYLYSSSLTNHLVNELKEAGSLLEVDDFKSYQPLVYTPPSITLFNRRYKVHAPVPPSGALLSVIPLLAMSSLSTSVVPKKNSKNFDFFFKLIETLKFSFVQEAMMDDEDPTSLFTTLTSTEYIMKIKEKIINHTYHHHNGDDNNHPSYYFILNSTVPPIETIQASSGAVHVSVIDEQGNAVSASSSINKPFGAAVASKLTGIIFNNAMESFTLPSAAFPNPPANRIGPRRRPMSFLSPLMVTSSSSDDLRMAIGASGGSLIPSALVQTLINQLHFELDIKESVNHPRLHHQFVPDIVFYEVGFDQDLLRLLETHGGYELRPTGRAKAGVNAVWLDPVRGHRHAFSDPRVDGLAAGY